MSNTLGAYHVGRFFIQAGGLMPARVLTDIGVQRYLLCRYGEKVHLIIPGTGGKIRIHTDIVIRVYDYAAHLFGRVLAPQGGCEFHTKDRFGIIDKGAGMPAVQVIEPEAFGAQLDPSFSSDLIN